MTSLDSYGYTLVTGRLGWRLQILPVHCLTLQYGYSSSPVHQGSKSGEADGSCRRHQYSPVYRRLANENKFKKSNCWFTIRPQGRASLPNSEEIYCLLARTVTMLEASRLSPGKLMSL